MSSRQSKVGYKTNTRTANCFDFIIIIEPSRRWVIKSEMSSNNGNKRDERRELHSTWVESETISDQVKRNRAVFKRSNSLPKQRIATNRNKLQLQEKGKNTKKWGEKLFQGYLTEIGHQVTSSVLILKP